MRKIRFGVIGTNTIVHKVMKAAQEEPRFELVAIYSRTQDKANEFARQYEVKSTFTSLEAMASSDLIDAVYIASPNSFHAEQSVLFMNHGKHVLCEKPLASNAKEVKFMIEASRRNKVTLMEGMMPTLSTNFKMIQESIAKLGTLRRYFATYCQYSSRYDNFLKGDVENAFKPELSNGAIMDIGIYCVYPMVVLFGKPKSISAVGMKLSTGVDGQGSVNFEYDEILGTIMFSKIADSYLPMEIQGLNGTILADRTNVINDVRLKLRGEAEMQIGFPLEKDNYYYEIEEFINLIEQGLIESDINSHQNSLITIEIIDEIRRQLGVVFPADK